MRISFLPRSAIAFTLYVTAGFAMAAEVTVINAARIHTGDPDLPQAQAMAYDNGGRILALGTTGALLAQYPGAARIDAAAATVIPGLIDAHGHVGDLGETRLIADLVDVRSKQDVIKRLQRFAERNPQAGADAAPLLHFVALGALGA